MKTYLLILLVLGLTSQSCTKGCLKCTSENKCTLCDTTSFYKSNEDGCLVVDQPNCGLINLEGDCLSCDDGYWLNTTTKKCVVVETEKKVENCSSYTSSQTCSNCEAHFIIEAAKCKAVTTQLTNCEVYQTATTCADCKNGYFVSTDGKSCESAPSISNCNHLSRYECDSCSGNYILNRNLYFKTSFKTTSSLEKTSTLLNVKNQKNDLKALQNNGVVCQETTATNCVEFETFNTCKTCSSGHFLKEDKTCEAYPKSITANCSIYSSNTTCTACNQGYYRVSSTECKAVTSVENCSEYSQTSNTSQCTKCNGEFYLASSTSCGPRTVSAQSLIANCKAKSFNSDKCAECNSGFVLASGGDECASGLDNCLLHNSFAKGTTPTCNTCNDGFYLLNSICTAGGDANCQTYLSTGTCDDCKNKFYHVGTSNCAEHLSISNCEVYHNTLKNTCESCENNTFNYEIIERCKLLAEIPNCMTYNAAADGATVASCSVCNEGFVLNGTTSCDLITVPNCSKGTATDTCTECKTDYVLYQNGTDKKTCVLPHEYMTDQCETVANTGGTNELDDVTCTNCKQNALPIDYTNTYVCVKNEYLTDAGTLVLTGPIDGCIKHEKTGSSLQCTLCDNGKYLSNDQSECVENCGDYGFEVMRIYEDEKDIAHYRCKSTDPTVHLDAPSLTDDTNISIKCKDNNPTVVNGVLTEEKEISNISLDGAFGSWVKKIGTSNPEVECPSDVTHFNTGTTTTAIQYCQYYKKVGTTAHCVKCIHGYYGVPDADADGDHIVSCSSMSDCNSSETYGNLLGTFSQFFSCHKCSNENKIPYLVYKMAVAVVVNPYSAIATGESIEFNGFGQFDLAYTGTFTGGDDSGHTVECINNSSDAAFKSAITATSDPTVVANCALGLLDLSQDTKSNTLRTYCAACKPGYAPGDGNSTGTISTPSPTAATLGTVAECISIDNCTNSEWFNSCSQCDTGYVHKVNSGKLSYTECVQQNDPNCYGAATANENCVFCNKGFVLNEDGVCVTVDTPKCQVGKYVPLLFHEDIDILDTTNSSDDTKLRANSRYFLWYNELGAGCNQCEAGYTSLYYSTNISTNSKSCAASSFVSANGTNFPDQRSGGNDSNYINNCESYIVGGLLCAKCNANFVLRDNGEECITLANCEVAANSLAKCKVCKTGFGLVNNLCAAGNIPNCSTYNVSNNNTTVLCETCNDGFYKTNTNTCEIGAVANCQTLGVSANVCTTCKDGYFKIAKNNLSASGNAHDYCYKMEDSLNCNAATIQTSDIGAKLTCTSCTVAYSVMETPTAEEAQTSCLAYNLIENCDTYNTNSSLATSTFLCSACKSGYYLTKDGYECVKRTVNPVGCKTYYASQDLCSSCNDGNFLTTSEKECTPFPSGVIGCMTYSDATTCTSCGSDTWLNEGVCTPVETEAKVTNCLLYSDAITCSTCQDKNFLEGNTCVALTVENCATVASKDACETCKQGYKLETANGKTNCVSHSEPNCLSFEQSGTNACIVCNQNFYVNADGKCANATPVIPQCLVNATKETCQLCNTGYALSVDKKTCVNASVFDSNCLTVSMPEKMSCAKCNPGYYFKNGECTAFSGKSLANGCFSQDLEDDQVCLVCNTGYYMNSSLNCVKIEVVNPDDKDDEDEDENINIIRSLIAMIVSLVFLF